jgi:adenosine deaminase
MLDYAPAFHRAADAGLGRTVHAGEGRPAAEIGVAIEELGAQRIGHGTTLLDDPEVLALVIERGVTIEACPTSNVHTGVISSIGDHPLKEWLPRGVRVCICPDNTFLSGVTASEELDRTVAALGLSADQRTALIQAGHEAAFAVTSIEAG